MNQIIHNCTHKDSDDTTFRITEEQMFIAIFNYIEHLFGKIKPKQLFFLAIDGVAPRAKMNQQRARRFRTALDAENAREKAIREGKEMPKEEAFDSNSITPGRSSGCDSHYEAHNYRYGVHDETDIAVEIFHQQKSFRRCGMARCRGCLIWA